MSVHRIRTLGPWVVAVLALFVALGGPSYAAGKISGNQIEKASLAGKALKSDTVTGDKINEATLAKVPAAAVADKATLADKATTAGSAAPSGPAAGALTGAYPNPQLANGAVTATKLGTIVTRDATSSIIAAGSNGDATATCQAGEQLIAGGSDGYYDLYVVAEAKTGNGWRVSVHNASSSGRTVTAHAYCLQ